MCYVNACAEVKGANHRQVLVLLIHRVLRQLEVDVRSEGLMEVRQ